MDLLNKNLRFINLQCIKLCPINFRKYSEELLQNHKQAVQELYTRDKNRPCVTIWSLANEPRSNLDEAENYYR